MAATRITANQAASRTYVPSADAESQVRQFADVLEQMSSAPSERPALVGPHGEEVALPQEAFDVLVQVFEAMKQGLAIQVAPLNAQLTTQEAANYLGVSRPTFVKLLDSGVMPFTRPGRHRYVRIDDVMAYADSIRRERSEILDSMARDAESDGLYDLLDGRPPAMR